MIIYKVDTYSPDWTRFLENFILKLWRTVLTNHVWLLFIPLLEAGSRCQEITSTTTTTTTTEPPATHRVALNRSLIQRFFSRSGGSKQLVLLGKHFWFCWNWKLWWIYFAGWCWYHDRGEGGSSGERNVTNRVNKLYKTAHTGDHWGPLEVEVSGNMCSHSTTFQCAP